MGVSLAKTIIYGSPDEVEALLKQGADINELDEYGYTPLIEAAIADKMDIAKLLIKQGANINAEDMTGRTALHWTTDNNNVEFCELLLKNHANANAYTMASQPILVNPLLRGQKKLRDILLRYHADLNFAKDYINTKLLAHRFHLQGVGDIVNHKGAFIEIGYEGFMLEFTLNVVYDSLFRFINNYGSRELRNFYPLFKPIIQSAGNAAELIRYQQYTIDKQQYSQRIHTLFQSELLFIPVAYTGHAVTFIKFGQYWIHCDRGEYGRENGCINVYRATNQALLNASFFSEMLYSKHDKNFVNIEIKRALRLVPLLQLPIAPQTTGNCSWANVEAGVFAMLFVLLQKIAGYKEEAVEENIKLSATLFQAWIEWDQEQALNDCIQSFRYSSPARKASKAALLGAILLQQCHHKKFRNVKRASKILNVLMIPDYQYVLKSYLDAYCKPTKSPAGKNLLELLEDCGVDPKKLF